MSLTVDGRAAVAAMLAHPDRFKRVKPGDWAGLAVKLARKQVTAAGQDADDLRAIRDALGEDIFDKTLDSLSATQAKQLVARIDPASPEDVRKTGASALAHVRGVLAGDGAPDKAAPPSGKDGETHAASPAGTDQATEPGTPRNAYFGRKAFRTGQ